MTQRELFEETALPHMDRLHLTALKWTRNTADAADLVQEAYLRAYRAFSTFRPGTNCKAWLFTIMYSVFANSYRKRQREGMVLSDEQIEEAYQKVLAANPNATKIGADGEVEQALAGLPEVFRTPVILVDMEELSYEEAAEVLKCPVGTVRSRLYRGRKLLYVALKDLARRMGYLEKF